MVDLIAGLILLAVLIVFHELGHFLVAKMFGVRVLTFSIGFGPRLFGFKKGHTDYRVSAVPLGGYVRMFGDQLTDEIPQEDRKFSFLHQPVWKKSLIAFAGPFFNFVLPIILFFFVFFGSERVFESLVGTVLPGEAAEKAGIVSGDRIIAIDGKSVSTFLEVVEIVSNSPGKPLAFEIERARTLAVPENFTVSITPAKEENLHPLHQGEFVGRVGVMPLFQKPVIVVPHPQSSAAKAGFKNFDEIVEINNTPVSSMQEAIRVIESTPQDPLFIKVRRSVGEQSEDGLEFQTFDLVLPKANVEPVFQTAGAVKRYAVTHDELQNNDIEMKVAKTRKVLDEAEHELNRHRGLAFVGGAIQGVREDTPAGELGVKPGDRIVALNGNPASLWVQVQKEWDNTPDEVQVIGVQSSGESKIFVFRLKPEEPDNKFAGAPKKEFGHIIEPAYVEGPTKTRQVGFFEALSRSFERTWELIWLTLKSLWMLATLQISVSQIGGPIAIFGVAGQAVQQGAAVYIFVMSLISVNLGILNLLPIPILDGGHILMFGIEAIQRKPLSIRTRQLAMKIGLVLLLLLMAVAIFNDVSRVFF